MLLASRDYQVNDFSMEHADVVTFIQTALKLPRMAHSELYSMVAYSNGNIHPTLSGIYSAVNKANQR